MTSYCVMFSKDGRVGRGVTFLHNVCRFAIEEEAHDYAIATARKNILVTDWRIEDREDPVTHTFHKDPRGGWAERVRGDVS